MKHFEYKHIKAVIGRLGEPREHHFGKAESEKARNFHQSFPEYAPTPLVS